MRWGNGTQHNNNGKGGQKSLGKQEPGRRRIKTSAEPSKDTRWNKMGAGKHKSTSRSNSMDV